MVGHQADVGRIYADLIGLTRSKRHKGMSSHATDLTVYVKIFFFKQETLKCLCRCHPNWDIPTGRCNVSKSNSLSHEGDRNVSVSVERHLLNCPLLNKLTPKFTALIGS